MLSDSHMDDFCNACNLSSLIKKPLLLKEKKKQKIRHALTLCVLSGVSDPHMNDFCNAYNLSRLIKKAAC